MDIAVGGLVIENLTLREALAIERLYGSLATLVKLVSKVRSKWASDNELHFNKSDFLRLIQWQDKLFSTCHSYLGSANSV